MATPIDIGNSMDWDEPLNGDPDFTSSHTFSTNDITVSFDGQTVANSADPTQVFDTTGANGTMETKDGVTLYPIDSEFGFYVTDFSGAEEKVLDGDYAEGWAGDVLGADDEQIGLVISDAPTDTFQTPAVHGTWLAGLGGNTVKASTEHYVVMQQVLSDQQYPGDPDAEYALDDNLIMVGGEYDGLSVKDLLDGNTDFTIEDVNGDGVVDIKDILTPNESTIAENIAVSTDYSVTLKDDGKLLYRWGNTVKRPNDVRVDVKHDLPDEWQEQSTSQPEVKALYRVTQAELVVHHTITNNPNDQVRPEDYENESATGTTPSYEIIEDYNGETGRTVWASTEGFYAGDGTFYESGTILKDSALADAWAASDLAAIGAQDGAEGFTNAWYTTMDREPFEPVLNEAGDEYIVGPRWRLQSDKYGQDLPSVVIPEDPRVTATPTKDQVKYEVGMETQTVLNLLDWETSASPLSLSAGFQNNSGQVSENGVNMSDQFDVALYVKGDVKPATLYSSELVLDYEEVAISGVGAAVAGGLDADYLVGMGDNVFTGSDGDDLFVASYGVTANWATIQNSTIEDFEYGSDILGLIDLRVTIDNFDEVFEQTVVGADLQISLDGYDFVTLADVTEELSIDDVLLLNRAIEDKIVGTEFDDYLVGDNLANEFVAHEGDDTVIGYDGDDQIVGRKGADMLLGDAGADMIDGRAGRDVLRGGQGRDVVTGGYGDDYVGGGRGNDIIIGESGNDFLSGGGADDLFIFEIGSGQDTIDDFGDGMDVIDVSAFGFADFAALEANISAVAGGSLINLGGGDEIFVSDSFGAVLNEDAFII